MPTTSRTTRRLRAERDAARALRDEAQTALTECRRDLERLVQQRQALAVALAGAIREPGLDRERGYILLRLITSLES